MSRVCPNLECENGEIYDDDGLEAPVLTCPDCRTTLEEFSTDLDDEEEEPEEDEEDGWESKYDDSVD